MSTNLQCIDLASSSSTTESPLLQLIWLMDALSTIEYLMFDKIISCEVWLIWFFKRLFGWTYGKTCWVICFRILGNFLSTLFKTSFKIKVSLTSLKEWSHSHLWKKSKIKPPLFLNKVATLMFCFFLQGTKQGQMSGQQWDSGHIIDINCFLTSN